MKTKTKAKRTVTTEDKIKRTLTRLQKLVHQYYDENPDTTDSLTGNKDSINYYGSVVVGISYNEFTDRWETIANITIGGKHDNYFDICSPINHKPVKQEYKQCEKCAHWRSSTCWICEEHRLFLREN